MNSKFTFQKSQIVFIKLYIAIVFININSIAQSLQDFGNTIGAHTTGASTTFIQNPTTGSNYVRVGSAGGSINKVTASNPLGTTQTFIRAVAPTSASVNKISPIVGNTAGKGVSLFET